MLLKMKCVMCPSIEFKRNKTQYELDGLAVVGGNSVKQAEELLCPVTSCIPPVTFE
jgi:hypothetical protein